MIQQIKSILQYQTLLKSSIKKEIRGKYKASFLGILWSFLNPLLTTLVYAIVFPIILKNTEPHYVTFIIIGILPWTFFITTIMQGTLVVLSNADIVKKVYFPREILPISVATSTLINFLISCCIIMFFLIASGIGFSWYLIYLPIIIFTQYILQLAIILITSAIEVYVRDAEYIINFFLNLIFYITPIVYSTNIFHDQNILRIINLNPMTTIVNGYRDVLFYQEMPELQGIFLTLLGGIVLLIIGFKVFSKLQKGFAEEM